MRCEDIMPWLVPNAPCGVERIMGIKTYGLGTIVPNVPCGVESKKQGQLRTLISQTVPNVPCGVESLEFVKEQAQNLESS